MWLVTCSTHVASYKMSKYLASLSSSATASGTGGEGHSGFSKWQVLTLLGLGVSVAAVSIGAVYLWRRRTSKRHKLPDRSVEPQEDGAVESKSSTVETEPQLPVSYDIYINRLIVHL